MHAVKTSPLVLALEELAADNERYAGSRTHDLCRLGVLQRYEKAWVEADALIRAEMQRAGIRVEERHDGRDDGRRLAAAAEAGIIEDDTQWTCFRDKAHLTWKDKQAFSADDTVCLVDTFLRAAYRLEARAARESQDG